MVLCLALNHYLQGHATGDPSHMRLAFLPTAHIANKVYVARPSR
jgi:putative lumazine-binding protein